jgi:hypothetical protein
MLFSLSLYLLGLKPRAVSYTVKHITDIGPLRTGQIGTGSKSHAGMGEGTAETRTLRKEGLLDLWGRARTDRQKARDHPLAFPKYRGK